MPSESSESSPALALRLASRRPRVLGAAVLSGLFACNGSSATDSGGDTVEPSCSDEPGCLLMDALPGGLLSVQAPASNDVWAVGASPDPADGTGPYLLHYDGVAWARLDTSAHAGAELWWAWVADDEAVFVGSEGLILELERSSEALTVVSGPSPETQFFGVWGASSQDLWAVGVEDTDEGSVPAAWRRVGGSWTRFEELPAFEGDQLLFKVHGLAEDDVWAVGSRGLAMHWDGATWTQAATDADVDTSGAPLLTVDAAAPLPTAVGGAGNGLILELDGGTWRDRSPDFVPGFNGVCSGSGQTWAVGQHGARARRLDGVWQSDFDLGVDDPLTLDDWHGCDVDPDGGMWMVGGRIANRPLTRGVLGYQGEAEPAPWP